VFFAQPPAFGGGDPWRPRREGNVTYFTVPFLKPGTTSALYNRLIEWKTARSGLEAVGERVLRSRLARLGVEPRPTFMTSNIYCAAALSRLPKKLLFYDFNDSPFQFSRVPAWARDYWRRTLPQVDAFFVVSEYYRRQLREQTDRPLIVIGNGVEMAHFERPRPVPPELADCQRPRIGYVGLLSRFLDFETLEALRRARRGGTLVLIGPGSPDTSRAVADLAGREGVRVLGPKPYSDLPAYVQALDVGVIPFRAGDPFVRGINPNKIYQYLAAGLPVVTTPVLDLEPAPGRVVFASDPAGMTRAVESVLDVPRDAEALRAMARPHDWTILAGRMVAEIEQRLARVS
jgi:teichuronic acid biosynthesis glycosyltransferase TuaH